MPNFFVAAVEMNDNKIEKILVLTKLVHNIQLPGLIIDRDTFIKDYLIKNEEIKTILYLKKKGEYVFDRSIMKYWKVGEEIIEFQLGENKYIKTIKNDSEEDNLGELPSIHEANMLFNFK